LAESVFELIINQTIWPSHLPTNDKIMFSALQTLFSLSFVDLLILPT